MTLFKAVEAAREALYNGLGECGCSCLSMCCGKCRITTEQASKQALAALPDKPMTEDEIFKIIHQIIYHGFGSGVTTTKVIEALKSANVLYVRED